MVSINYATREVSCKIVYYGPGLSGKTTNLQYVHQKVPANTKGKLISLATDADRTLYFDFLPINIGTINGFASKFQLYTVPGQVYYNATRKLVLRGVDGLVFVADSQPDKMDENIESLNNLKENLAEYGYKIDELPIVIQYNKQDLPNVLSPEDMHSTLNPKGWPEFKASATEGFGVFDTLKCILKLVLDKAKARAAAPASRQPAATAVSSSAPASTGMPAQPQAGSPVGSQPPPREPRPAQPVTPMAPAAQEISKSPSQAPQSPVRDPQPQPVGVGIQTAPMPGSASRPMEYTNKPQAETEAPAQAPQPSQYRPFPGNTAEDEIMMQNPPSPGGNIYGQGAFDARAPKPENVIDTGTKISKPTESPRMAPSLKADRPRRKKRSFFKRLFGLK